MESKAAQDRERQPLHQERSVHDTVLVVWEDLSCKAQRFSRFGTLCTLLQRDPKQRFLSTSVGRSLIEDDDDEDDDDGDDVNDVEAERTRVRVMIKVLRL